jgi:predicted 2-oxoglutarate/Fe(II)-dependent dioxygenase YbiX
MDIAAVLTEAGILRIDKFMSSDVCAELCREAVRSTVSQECMVYGTEYAVDRSVRRHRQVTVRDETLAHVRARLSELGPLLAARFGKTLTGMQEPEFYAYDPGDFIVFHRDASGDATEPERLRAMKVSVVLFLNDEKPSADEPSCAYQGGALDFYASDLVAGPAYEGAKVSVHGSAGLLVAFDPSVRHQVREISGGTRVTVVTWFT